MTNAEPENGGVPSAISSRVRRNKRTVIGVTGLAAVLGVGALLVTHQVRNGSGAAVETTGETEALPARTAGSPSPLRSGRAASGGAAVMGPVAPAVSGAKSVAERLREARSANQRLGTEVRQPAPRPPTHVDPSKVKVVQTGSNQTGHMMRVSSAPFDLTGYRELAWVRDGARYGDATCTQKITVSQNVPARERLTLLICWRTSAKKSAYTVAIDFHKRPSAADSVAELDKAWAAIR
ncbi:hypothetical protein [Actinoplanes subtropicus]|uniref:hypothetical protein n=1 Tax=Actinoplanes subtropicus TaxID=543632 RepID=UPI0004C460DD|nr:hypothetical protein [Actinoplanes subtropicus]